MYYNGININTHVKLITQIYYSYMQIYEPHVYIHDTCMYTYILNTHPKLLSLMILFVKKM